MCIKGELEGDSYNLDRRINSVRKELGEETVK